MNRFLIGVRHLWEEHKRDQWMASVSWAEVGADLSSTHTARENVLTSKDTANADRVWQLIKREIACARSEQARPKGLAWPIAGMAAGAFVVIAFALSPLFVTEITEITETGYDGVKGDLPLPNSGFTLRSLKVAVVHGDQMQAGEVGMKLTKGSQILFSADVDFRSDMPAEKAIVDLRYSVNGGAYRDVLSSYGIVSPSEPFRGEDGYFAFTLTQVGRYNFRLMPSKKSGVENAQAVDFEVLVVD